MAVNPLFSKIASAAANVQKRNNGNNEEDPSAAKKAGSAAAGAAALIGPAPLIKWGTILGLIILLAILLSGAITGIAKTAENITYPAKCNPTISNDVASELEKAGQPVSAEEKASWDSNKTINACEGGGVGYTGDTFPPTNGSVTTDFMVVDSLHPNGHNGTDIAGACDDPIYAYSGGVVASVIMGSEEKGGPIMGSIFIKHTEEFTTVYYHTKGSTTTVKEGQVVSAGDQIATQWSNGLSTGCHLHIEARINGVRTDARAMLNAAGYDYQLGANFTTAMFPPKPVPGGGGGTGTITAPPGSAKAEAQSQLNALGMTSPEEWTCLESLWTRESGWRVDAQNNAFSPSSPPAPAYQAYGIPQGAPGSKMASAGADWQTNPATQIRWGLGYIVGRYATPCGAWAHSEANNWY